MFLLLIYLFKHNIFLYFLITVYVQYYFVLGSDVQHSSQIIIYFTTKCSPDISGAHLAPHSYYNITDCIPYTILYILGLFCNYQFVVLNPFTFFTQPFNLPPFWQPSVCSLESMSQFLFCLFIYFILWILHINEITWYLSSSVWLS